MVNIEEELQKFAKIHMEQGSKTLSPEEAKEFAHTVLNGLAEGLCYPPLLVECTWRPVMGSETHIESLYWTGYELYNGAVPTLGSLRSGKSSYLFGLYRLTQVRGKGVGRTYRYVTPNVFKVSVALHKPPIAEVSRQISSSETVTILTVLFDSIASRLRIEAK